MARSIFNNFVYVFFVMCIGFGNVLLAQPTDKLHREMSRDRSLEGSLYMLNMWTEPDHQIKVSSQLAAIAHQILSDSPDADFNDLLASSAYREFCKENQIMLLGGPMLGNISHHGVDVWIRTAFPAKVEVEIQMGKGKKLFGPIHTSGKSDLSGVVQVRGLKPGAEYRYKILLDGKPVVSHGQPSFQTPSIQGSGNLTKIAFGTCFHRWGLGNMGMMEQIVSRRPHAMLLGGDIAVQDRLGHHGMHRFDYIMRDMFPAWRLLASNVPVFATWDDHDYMDDDLSGIPTGFTNKDRDGIRKVFKQSWANPAYGFEKQDEGVFFRTRIGPADVIMVDNRFFRDRQKVEFLGSNQMEWLEKQLLDCKGPFIILSCGTMWSDFVSNGKDSWGTWDPEGRERIFQLIEKNQIGGVLLISGDRHGARGFRIPRPSGFNFYEFEPASLGGRSGPPAVHEDWETQLFGVSGVFAFGEFTFDTNLSDPEVTFRLIKEDGSILYDITLKRSDLTPKHYK